MAARAYAGTRVAPRRRPTGGRRPAARRRPAPRRGASRIHWDRLGRVALTLVLGAIMVSYLNPLIGFVHTYRDSTAAKAQLHELLSENKALHRRVKSANDASVLEGAARRLGMIAPGERAYVVHGLNR